MERLKTSTATTSTSKGGRNRCVVVVVLVAVGILNGRKGFYSMPATTITSQQDDFSLAKQQSFGFFDDISTSQWNKLRQIVAEHKPHLYMDDPLAYSVGNRKHAVNGKIPQAWFQSHYEPNFSCQFQRRVGGNGNGDGPKNVCDIHRLTRIAAERQQHSHIKGGADAALGCLIYSIGSNGDFSFEVAVQELVGHNTCEIHIFDMGDYEGIMPQNMNLHYHKWGLDSTNHLNNKGEEFKTLKDTIQLLGHTKRPAIDLFKIDCEGCEFDTYQDWISNSNPDIPHLQQILVEVHYPPPNNKALEFFDGFLKAGYVTFSKEVNIQFPGMPLVEYSFLKLDQSFFQKEGNAGGGSC